MIQGARAGFTTHEVTATLIEPPGGEPEVCPGAGPRQPANSRTTAVLPTGCKPPDRDRGFAVEGLRRLINSAPNQTFSGTTGQTAKLHDGSGTGQGWSR